MRSEEIKNQMNQKVDINICGEILALETDFREKDRFRYEKLYMIIKNFSSINILKITLINQKLVRYFSDDDVYIEFVNHLVKVYQRVIKELEEESKKSLLSK